MNLREIKQRKLAAKTSSVLNPIPAQAANNPADREYNLLMARLQQDTQNLKSIESKISKAETKGVLIQNYMPWVDGAIQNDKPYFDEIVMTMLVWSIDAAAVTENTSATVLYEKALDIFKYALKHEFPLPDKYGRPLVSFVAEEIANAALKNDKFDVHILESLYETTLSKDMIDEVRSKLCKAYGLGLLNNLQENTDQLALYEKAIGLLETADKLDVNASVKTVLKKTKKEFENIQTEQSGHPD